MKNKITESKAAHQEISLLLPWYVNKTLQGNESQAVEEHLKVCLTCKRELAQLQKLAKAVAQEGVLDTAERASFSRLKKRLNEGPRPEQQPIPSSSARQNQPENAGSIGKNVTQMATVKVSKWPKTGIYQSALAMAAVLLLSLLVPRYFEIVLKQDHGFRTLSSDKQQAPDNLNEIRVVFADGVNQQEKNGIVERIHGRIVAKPTEQGVYTVRLDGQANQSHVLEAIGSLRKDTHVIFAEPTYALLSAMHPENKE